MCVRIYVYLQKFFLAKKLLADKPTRDQEVINGVVASFKKNGNTPFDKALAAKMLPCKDTLNMMCEVEKDPRKRATLMWLKSEMEKADMVYKYISTNQFSYFTSFTWEINNTCIFINLG